MKKTIKSLRGAQHFEDVLLLFLLNYLVLLIHSKKKNLARKDV